MPAFARASNGSARAGRLFHGPPFPLAPLLLLGGWVRSRRGRSPGIGRRPAKAARLANPPQRVTASQFHAAQSAIAVQVELERLVAPLSAAGFIAVDVAVAVAVVPLQAFVSPGQIFRSDRDLGHRVRAEAGNGPLAPERPEAGHPR